MKATRDVSFSIQKLWMENKSKTQQSTIALTILVAAPMGEGVEGMGAKAW